MYDLTRKRLVGTGMLAVVMVQSRGTEIPHVVE